MRRVAFVIAAALLGSAALAFELQGCGGCTSDARPNSVTVTPTASCLGLTVADADGKVLLCGTAISVRGHDDCGSVFSISPSPLTDGGADVVGDGGPMFTDVFQPGEAIEFAVTTDRAATAPDGTMTWSLPAQLGDGGAQVIISIGPK